MHAKIKDYRIVHTKEQKFIALTGSFRNERIDVGCNQDIPDFWDECHAKNLIEPIRNFRPEGKRDLYGLCSPAKEGEDTFEYGIGIMIDEETMDFDMDEMKKAGYCIWDVKPGTYVVFDCMGEDSDCISDAWSKFYREFLPRMGYEPEAETDYEIYFEKGRKGLFCELWIPVRKNQVQ
ncbi:MAG: GyrI-like domain-containing protein [Lachnospiraceae bacterium]|nr:GyrI-like domain-containing protein [Lachnospiraceae bacterium]